MKNRKLLMIPGPIEFDPEVMAAMSVPTTSHVAADFIECFGEALDNLRKVFLCEDGQPIVLAGSGTLAMDTAAANLVEPGDRALAAITGYFTDRFVSIMERYGAKVTSVNAPVGGRPGLDEIEQALKTGNYKLLVATHVDTSTGVVNDIQGLANLSRKYGTLFVVDGVCSVAAEPLRMSEWGVDLALTASQKAIGVPPGLALVMVGPRAMNAFKARKTPVLNYYADWNNWLPIMEAYQARKVAYFATPAVNLVYALQVSLKQILAEGLEARFARHEAIQRASQAAIKALGLGQVPLEPAFAAHTLSAPRYPEGLNAGKFLAATNQAGVILAGGLHPAIKSEYFRIGHMGACTIGDLLATFGAIERGLAECGYLAKESSVKAALNSYYQV